MPSLLAPDGPAPAAPVVLVLDNLDSFTHSLVQIFRGLGAQVEVFRDAIPAGRTGDLVLLSPGPGRPEEHPGLMAEVRRRRAPLFGVCLGMQAIALEAGGVVARGRPVHGRTSAIHHNGTGLFAGLPSPFRATRYHSLRCVALPPSLDVTARSSDGTAMALHSRIHPAWGVQFHPESVRTQLGPRLCANVLALATARGSL